VGSIFNIGTKVNWEWPDYTTKNAELTSANNKNP